MLLRELFFSPKHIILEGGNALIGGHRSEKIDLKQISRAEITPIIWNLLVAINGAYQTAYKKPLWLPELMRSREFLSGSSFHFFNQNIPHEEFTRVKPLVGDIDTQLDKDMKPNIDAFLNQIQGKALGGATLVGAKESGKQIITIWEFNNPAIKIQIDLELVDYENDKPTEWAKFSHSSSWEDLQAGIKGVFHKYLMRAFTTNTLKPRYIKKPRSIKYEMATDVAFSADYGLRPKYHSTGETYDDGEHGPHEVYTEIPIKDSEFTNTTSGMFEMIFGRPPKGNEANHLSSFKGGLILANHLLDTEHKEKIFNGFLNTLFGPAAQQMYRDNPDQDRTEKLVALDTMAQDLNLSGYYASSKNNIDQQIANYYQNIFKVRESINEDVKASPREGIAHLQKMNDLQFIQFVEKIQHQLGGRLDGIRMTLKVDGLGARFGKDADGRPFFESSHSGPIFTHGSFSAHALSKGFEGEKLQRAIHYDEIYNLITSSDFVKNLPNDTKVSCEIMYNPMAELTDTGIKFVTVEYDHNKLGKLLSIVPHYALVSSTGARHPDSEQIKDQLLQQSDDRIKFIDDRLTFSGEIDVSAIIDPVASLNNRSKEVLGSRMKADAADKQEVKALIQTIKDQLADFILKHPNILGKDVVGNNIEGLILHRDDGAPVKVTTPEFKSQLAAKMSQQMPHEPEKKHELA